MIDLFDLVLNIPHDQGLSTLRKRFDEKDEKNGFADTLLECAEYFLNNNILSFNEKNLRTKKRRATTNEILSVL